MKIDKVSKIYRKLVCCESEYQSYRIIENLDAETAKQVLYKMVTNKAREVREIAN